MILKQKSRSNRPLFRFPGSSPGVNGFAILNPVLIPLLLIYGPNEVLYIL